MDAHLHAIPLRTGGQLTAVIFIKNSLGNSIHRKLLRIFRRRIAKYQQRVIEPGSAHLDCLFQIGYGKPIHPSAAHLPRRIFHAVAVGVRLDNGHHLRFRSNKGAYFLVVSADGVEVNLQPSAFQEIIHISKILSGRQTAQGFRLISISVYYKRLCNIRQCAERRKAVPTASKALGRRSLQNALPFSAI